MRHIKSGSKAWGRRGVFAGLTGLALALAGCTGSEDTSSANPAAITINSPAQIAQMSAEDYNDNVNGLITGQTLEHWIDDWENNRPVGISGRLVILQVTTGPEGAEYISPKPAEGVLTYRLDTNRLTQVRSNGVIETIEMVPEGSQVDAFLQDYNIDPRSDMVVCAMASGNFFATMLQGRCWYLFRYWGASKTNLAMLNGAAARPEVMDSTYLSGTATCDEHLMVTQNNPNCLPRNGRVSVRDLPEDNTSMMASLEDVIAVAEGRRDAFLWDARSATEYTAVQGLAPPAGKYLGIDFRNNASMQGHPRNAVLLPYANLLTSDGTFRYKDKATLAAFMNGETVDGASFQRLEAGSLIDLGVGNAYRSGQTVITYCETTYRAMITGFASIAILGLPNQFYDGAMVEWNSLSGGVQDRFGSFILPANSPWRTDLETRSVWEYNTPPAIDPRTIQDPFAARTNAVVAADRAYRLGAAPGAGSGNGGIVLPVNPCGG